MTRTLPPALATAALAAALLAAPAEAQPRRVPMTAADIEAASYAGRGDLPAGQSALTAKVQVLLKRGGVSPGVVDGFRGGMSDSAIRAFERKNGLPQDGRMDPAVWALLAPLAAEPLTQDYTITAADAEGLVATIPTDYAEKAAMPSMGYTSIAEKLGERFHMDDKFLVQLNPGVTLEPGATIKVTVPARPLRARVDRIIINKETGRVAAYDASGTMVADYPATVGSADTPSPHGTHTVRAVALDPTYTYNPNINFKQGDNDKVLTIPPGPNGPVGNVWIALSKPTYGIHGTPTPSRLFVSQSHGCVRLTNWDGRELAGMVQPGKTVVEFLGAGEDIADVSAPATPPADAGATPALTAGAPRPRPAGLAARAIVAETAAPAPAAQVDAAAALPPAAPGAALPGNQPAVVAPAVPAAPAAVNTADPLARAVQDATRAVPAAPLPALPAAGR